MIAVLVLFFASQAGAVVGCSVSTVAVGFGGYDTSLAFAHDADGAVNVVGTSGTPYAIRIDAGANSMGGFLPREIHLSGGTYLLGYNLYHDSARTQIWGDGTGTGVKQSISVYGSLPGGHRGVAARGLNVCCGLDWILRSVPGARFDICRNCAKMRLRGHRRPDRT